MKTTLTALTFAALALFVLACGGSEHNEHDHATHADSDSSGEPDGSTAALQNTKCPVTDEAVDPKISTEHDGKTVYFCCEDCVEKFLSDPESYPVAGK